MATHVVTALVKEKERLLTGMLGYGWQWEPVLYAMETADWCKLLDSDHWKEFVQITIDKDMNDYLTWIDKVLPLYKNYHEYLGKPETYEDWIKAIEEKYEADAYEFDKTRMRLLFPPTEVIKRVNHEHRSVDNSETS